MERELEGWERRLVTRRSKELKEKVTRSRGGRRAREQMQEVEEKRPAKKRRYKLLGEEWGTQGGADDNFRKVERMQLPIEALRRSTQSCLDGFVTTKVCKGKPSQLAGSDDNLVEPAAGEY